MPLRLVLGGCLSAEPPPDEDADGRYAAEDCDDHDAAVGGPVSWYADADGDGFGDPRDPVEACAAPDGYVDNDGDGNDASVTSGGPTTWYRDADGDAEVHPGATDVCRTARMVTATGSRATVTSTWASCPTRFTTGRSPETRPAPPSPPVRT